MGKADMYCTRGTTGEDKHMALQYISGRPLFGQISDAAETQSDGDRRRFVSRSNVGYCGGTD